MLNSLFRHWSYRILAPGTMLREKYEAFKELLYHDTRCHEEMAYFQDMLHHEQPWDFACIRLRFTEFSEHVLKIAESLDALSPGKYGALKSYHKKFDFYTRFLLAPPKISSTPPYLLELRDVSLTSPETGNKTKHLAVLEHELGIPVPRSFTITANGFHLFIEHNNLRGKIDALLAQIDIGSVESLTAKAEKMQKLLTAAQVPPVLKQHMLSMYDNWQTGKSEEIALAVRSSALQEDDESSFAGQYASRLNISRDKLTEAYRDVLASKYTAEALFYRINKGYGDEETAMSVLIQEMVVPKCSGILYTGDVEAGKQRVELLHLHVIEGLGENLVSGKATPEYYALQKSCPAAIISSTQKKNLLSAEQLDKLVQFGMRIEDFFKAPQDIEWALGTDGKIRILQARTLAIPEDTSGRPEKFIKYDNEILADNCIRASGGVGSGESYVVDEEHPYKDVPEGAVLVTRDTPPSYVTVIPKVSAVVAEHGSRASHFATVAREFAIPFLTGIEQVGERVQNHSHLTVDGNRGVLYCGLVDRDGNQDPPSYPPVQKRYRRILAEALKFITPLELVDPTKKNFTPEGCRSMHDIIRFSHEKALQEMFTKSRPGTGIGSRKLKADIPLAVYLFDVGGGIAGEKQNKKEVALQAINSRPFQALWQGLAHPDVQWKQKPFDWEAFDRIELSGGVAPSRDSFAFASYGVVGTDYLHFNIRFGYHFTIVDVLCGDNKAENHCMLRFAGGGGDYDHRSLRIDFLVKVLERLEFEVEKKGDLLEAKILQRGEKTILYKLDYLGRLLGATKLMDMVLEDEQMVAQCVEDFFNGRYSFSEQG